MSAIDVTGWLAAALTLLTFSMQSMIALRLVAVGANVSFIAYGIVASLEPVLVLHLLLLPCNLIRLGQLLARHRNRRSAPADGMPSVWCSEAEGAPAQRRKGQSGSG